MVTAARHDYESLPFLNVFSPEYTKDPLAAIRALGEGQAMARSPRGLECLSYDLSWELLRDERFPVGFEELLTMTGLTPEGGTTSLPATRRRWKARSTDDKGACLRRSLARRQSNERAGSHDASSRNCSMA